MALCPIWGARRCTTPARRGWTSALGGLGGTSTFVALICNSVRSFETPTLPECRFWKGSHSKTSNEMASEGVAEAFSFEVLQRTPFQNTGSGRVRILKLRTKSLLRGSQKRFRSKF